MWVVAVAEDEGVVEEGAGIEEDGFGFEEEFGEEGEVLGVELTTIRLVGTEICLWIELGVGIPCVPRHRAGGSRSRLSRRSSRRVGARLLGGRLSS